MPRDRFEALVLRAIDDLPAEFADRIANLEFSIEDWATPDDVALQRAWGPCEEEMRK